VFLRPRGQMNSTFVRCTGCHLLSGPAARSRCRRGRTEPAEAATQPGVLSSRHSQRPVPTSGRGALLRGPNGGCGVPGTFEGAVPLPRSPTIGPVHSPCPGTPDWADLPDTGMGAASGLLQSRNTKEQSESEYTGNGKDDASEGTHRRYSRSLVSTQTRATRLERPIATAVVVLAIAILVLVNLLAILVLKLIDR